MKLRVFSQKMPSLTRLLNVISCRMQCKTVRIANNNETNFTEDKHNNDPPSSCTGASMEKKSDVSVSLGFANM